MMNVVSSKRRSLKPDPSTIIPFLLNIYNDLHLKNTAMIGRINDLFARKPASISVYKHIGNFCVFATKHSPISS